MTEQTTLEGVRMAQQQLEAFLERSPRDDDMVTAAILLAFKSSFEALCRLIDAAATAEGASAYSPRRAIEYGRQRGLWKEEAPWLLMLGDRLLADEAFDPTTAKHLADRIRDSHAATLRQGIDAIAAGIPASNFLS